MAGIVGSTRTALPSHHPSELQSGPRYPGIKARQQHFCMNNIDVCAATFALAHGLTDAGLRAAVDMDPSDRVKDELGTILSWSRQSS